MRLYRETKPLHDCDRRLQREYKEKNKLYGNGNGQIWAQIEKRKRRHFCKIGYIKKVHIG